MQYVNGIENLLITATCAKVSEMLNDTVELNFSIFLALVSQ